MLIQTQSLRTRLVAFFALIVILTIASAQLRADTGTCGGASTTLPFTDVPSSNIFFCSIASAYFSGLTNGTSATTFNPSGTVSREQMAAFVTRTLDQSLRRGSSRAALDQWSAPAFDNDFGEIVVGATPRGVKSDGADLWVANSANHTVSRVRASDGQLLGTWTGALSASAVLVARGRVFVTGDRSPGRLYMIDPTQPPGAVTVLSSSLGASPQSIAFDGRRIWTANVAGGSVSMYDLTSGTLATVAGFSNPWGITYDGANMWVTNAGDTTIKKLDASGFVVHSVPVGSLALFPVFDGTNIWVPNNGSNSITVVRVKDGQGNPLAIPFLLTTLTGNGLNSPFTAAFDGERILVTNGGGDSVSLWKGADLTPLGSFHGFGGDFPYGACSDGVNFWVTLNGFNRLKRF
jgi:S-layer family protein